MREKLFILIVLVLVCCSVVSGQAFASRNSSPAAVGQTCKVDQLTEDDSPGQQTGFFRKMRTNVFSYLQQNVPFISRVYIGMGYRSASNPDTTGESDCSNLVNAITRNSLIGTDYDFAPNGISSQDLRENCQYVSLWDLKPGDLIFFSKGRKHNIIYHVGVITKVLFGTVHFVHASSNYGVVETVSGSETWRHYWGKKLHSFGRWKPDVFVKKSDA
ncbi:NlpC/P60 family protein [Candidatus Magnetominusculus dajiuhuensis]|uniref:NlpC/P60 family protein n=1 Tax=Candidatus Magnetominusculus dajiuhuensis TaxID=3137712 RepID=UPI003B438FA1